MQSRHPVVPWLLLFLLLCCVSEALLGRFAVSQASFDLRRSLALTSEQTALVYSLFVWGMVAGAIPMTALSIWRGSRVGFAAALAGSGLALVGCGMATSYESLAVLRFLGGFFSAGLIPAALQALASCFSRGLLGVALALVFASITGTTIVASPMLGMLARGIDGRTLMLSAGLASVLFAVVWFAVARLEDVTGDWSAALGSPSTWVLLAGGLGLGAMQSANISGPMALWANQISLGSYFSAVPYGAVAGALLAGLLSDLAVDRRLAILGAGAAMALAGLHAFTHGSVLTPLLGMATAAGIQCFMVTLYAGAAKSLTPRGVALAAGLATMGLNLSNAAVPMAWNLTAQATRGYWSLGIGVLLAMAAVAVAMVVSRCGVRLGEREGRPDVFALRLGGYVIDSILVTILSSIVAVVLSLALTPAAAAAAWIGVVAAIVVQWLYFALCESSVRGATPGKAAMGLRVSGQEGQPVSFGQATLRHFAKLLSTPLAWGYVKAAVDPAGQAFHDSCAKCFVRPTKVPEVAPPLPPEVASAAASVQ